MLGHRVQILVLKLRAPSEVRTSHEWNGEQIGLGQPEGASGIMIKEHARQRRPISTCKQAERNEEYGKWCWLF